MQMEDRMLTYDRICQLLRDGLQKNIPSGYNMMVKCAWRTTVEEKDEPKKKPTQALNLITIISNMKKYWIKLEIKK